ncbi:hypothetical protein MNBD_DELTA03-822 [hydrothermal vent metagenome]|uniref:Zinc ABC transporter, substrate-binding protein ZnuA n=1 Tax=hydrothermal vent metagenome TaxID=652676 RepID=A0A3B0V9A1_9ZZZZ
MKFIVNTKNTKNNCLAFIIFFFLCGPLAAAPLRVVTVIPPHASIVKKIGGSFVKVYSLIKSGQNPHTFAPRPRQIMKLEQAAALFVSGLPFEKRLVAQIKSRDKQLKIINLDAGLTLRHDKDGDIDPHVWMSPPLLRRQAATITTALCRLDPAHRLEYTKRHQALDKRIQQLDTRIKTLLRPFAGRTFYVFHPAFAYFGAAYGLHQRAVEVNGGDPSPQQLSRLIKQAKKDGVKIIFTQPEFDQRSARVVARAINGTVLPLDPMAPDILQNFNKIALALQNALKK